LKDIGEVSEREDIVEFGGGGQKNLRRPGVQGERGVDHGGHDFVHRRRKLVVRAGDVLLQDGQVDGEQRFLAGEADGEHGEVAQQTRVDGEGAGRRVHAGHVLRVEDVLQSQFRPVVPVAVVQVLSQQRVRLHCAVRVHLKMGQIEAFL